MRNAIHNIFIDHVDHSANDSRWHHHHNRSKDTDNGDIIYHKHDGAPGHGHYLTNHNSPSGYDYYANGLHNHRPVNDIIFIAVHNDDDFDNPAGFLDNNNDDGAAQHRT